MRRALQTRLAWVQLPGLSKALNSGDLVFFVHDREGQAGVHSSAVDLDRTRATLAAIVSEADGTRARQSSNRSVHGSVAKFRWRREDGLNTSGAGHVRVQVASV